jgi:hypothetical protein
MIRVQRKLHVGDGIRPRGQAPPREPTAERFNVHPRQVIVQITRTGRRSRHFTDRLHLTSPLWTFAAEGFQRIAAGLPPNDRKPDACKALWRNLVEIVALPEVPERAEEDSVDR